MNKLVKSLFLIATLFLALSSCKEEAEIPGHGAPGNPEKEIAGTYVGTWTKIQRNSTTDPVTAEGSITFTPTDETYIAIVKLESSSKEFDFKNKSNFASDESRTNVVNRSTEYVFFNPLATNGIGTAFNGTVSFSGEATIAFSKTIRDGRKTYTYDYSFEGTKQ